MSEVLESKEEAKEEVQYQPRTEAELFEIAKGIYENQIFSNLHIEPRDNHLLNQIFLPLALATQEQLDALIKAEMAMFYAPMSAALPRSLNGYPMFTVLNALNKPDADKVLEYHQQIKLSMDAMKPTLASPPSNKETENAP